MAWIVALWLYSRFEYNLAFRAFVGDSFGEGGNLPLERSVTLRDAVLALVYPTVLLLTLTRPAAAILFLPGSEAADA